jgi:beta-1,4-mannosyltransferase
MGGSVRVLASPYLEETNPFPSLLYDAIEKHHVEVSAFSSRKLLSESWDVWHLHWPERIATFLGLLKFLTKLRVARFKKTKIFWTAHNLRLHEPANPLLERIFWRIFLPNVDGIICMSKLGEKQLCAQYPRARTIPTFLIPHGHYRGTYPDVMSKTEARKALKVASDQFVTTFLGQIRPYKGVAQLIRCFVDAQVTNAQLIVAGKPLDDATLKEITEAAAINSAVRLFPGFVDHNDIQKFLRATDLVVLPYKQILHSGSVILALSFDRPILVPALGALAELQESVGSDWVRLYKGELHPETIRSAIHWVRSRQLGPDARAPLEELNWDRIAEATIRAFSISTSLRRSRPLRYS